MRWLYSSTLKKLNSNLSFHSPVESEKYIFSVCCQLAARLVASIIHVQKLRKVSFQFTNIFHRRLSIQTLYRSPMSAELIIYQIQTVVFPKCLSFHTPIIELVYYVIGEVLKNVLVIYGCRH